ncbi:MAG: hypothetical protein PHC28_10805 [Flavobacterium sp.]|uniref:hypothetical protein n=1 Tax=Flavobacterium sp. TaxID=239 RepID=UPI0026233763|nr:hypothetical protein [Flavobacterium sp.]MDD5150945.1 hypothetical protein [Flavobacterium sp.]
MSNNLDFIISDLRLSEAQFYDSNKILVDNESSTFNGLFHKNIQEIYNTIIIQFNNSISDFQKEVLANLFDSFSYISKEIDPLRLNFKFAFNEDEELIIYRKTENSIVNLIIHPYDDIAVSIIKKNGEKKLQFFQINDDLEKISLLFFSF